MNRIVILIIFCACVACLLLGLAGCPKNPHDVTGKDDDDTVGDTTRPQSIVDLHLQSFGIATATVCWTAPSDDHDSSSAYAYDFRISTDSLTAANFDVAEQLWSPSPLAAGEEQCLELQPLDGELTYFVALRATDEANNWSGLSNCVRVTCLIDSIVNFPDSQLEAVIRLAIHNAANPIRRSHLDTVRALTAIASGLTDLTGLQYCPRLTTLNFGFNQISSLEPLRHLDSLETILITSNQLTSIEPLSGLDHLTWLEIGSNPLTDLAPLAQLTTLQNLTMYQMPDLDFSVLQHLTHLERLGMGNNHISNLSLLSGATQLNSLTMINCQLVDLSALQHLPSLNTLYLVYNQIEDILPLVNNPGIGDGDNIALNGNPLSDSSLAVYIPALQTRGVVVSF